MKGAIYPLIVTLTLLPGIDTADMVMGRASSEQTEHEYTNSLIHEKSPYLLQHAHNLRGILASIFPSFGTSSA